MKNPQLILIDGSSYLYRAFHAFRSSVGANLSNSHGQPTGAIFGVINMVRSLLASYPESQTIMIFDAKGKTFRHDMYSEYKANRPSMPDELRSQVDYIHRIIKAMGLPLVAVTGVEADDVIGTYAKQAEQTGKTVLVSTGDKDLAQIVTDNVNLIDTMKDVIYDEQGVIDKFGIKPEQIIDYLTLVGDSSDNIPGVPKVGPKTAVKWLHEYQTLQGIIDNADSIGGKVGENLRDALEAIPLSKELVTIRCDMEMEQDIVDLKSTEPDQQQLIKLYSELEFKKWLEELNIKELVADSSSPSTEQPASRAADNNYQCVLEQAEFDKWIAKLAAAESFAFDTETTSLDVMQAELVGVSFAIEPGEAAYVPVAHNYMGAPNQLDRDYVLAALKPLLEDLKLPKIGQNLKYDCSVLANYNIHMQGMIFDTMLESYVLDSVSSRHDMDTLAIKHLGLATISFSDIAGKGKGQLTFDQIDLEQAAPYAAEDADITLRLHHSIMPELAKHDNLKRVYEQIEIPLVPVLSRVERNGVRIDDAMLHQQSQYLAESMLKAEKTAYEIAGTDFNMASPKQIQEILYEKMELPVRRKTPKGQPSTAEDVLQELALEYELPKIILEHRSLGKLKSTYTDKLPTMVSAKTGRVHTSYHQAVTATGRLSSSNPNLQNIPIRTEEGKRIRQAFIADADNVLLAADYSQIELRIMAHLSGDNALLHAFNTGADVHSATAAQVFNVDIETISSEQRRHAKAINFGLIYGMSAFGLAKQLGLGRAEAQKYIEQYFTQYPGVKNYMDTTRAKAHEDGYVETVFGRRLYLPEIKSSNHQRRQYAERTAINAPMQGTAADLIKMAMIEVDKWLQQNNDGTRMIMQVHDELVFEVAEQDLAGHTNKIIDIMQNVAELSVPLIVDAGSGNNWSDAH